MSEETATPAPTTGESVEDRDSLRKTRVGVVTSDKMNKTIVVEVERRVLDRLAFLAGDRVFDETTVGAVQRAVPRLDD